MDYVTIAGVCKRTDAKEDQLAVFLLKELVDNAIDYIELYAPPITARTTKTNGSISSIENEEPQIHADITYNHNDQYLVIRVKNSNFGIEDAGFTEQRLHSIFANLDVFHSSKRNQFKVSRGMQGDALKEVLCIPYVLATKYQSYFDNIVWDDHS
jgi:DNA topoisomerase VI subunit B